MTISLQEQSVEWNLARWLAKDSSRWNSICQIFSPPGCREPY